MDRLAPIEKIRCGWSLGSPEYIEYHDRDWGVPVHDDRLLFEMLTLEGAQAGLAWITILRKRATYRKAFANFDPKKSYRVIEDFATNGELDLLGNLRCVPAAQDVDQDLEQ